MQPWFPFNRASVATAVRVRFTSIGRLVVKLIYKWASGRIDKCTIKDIDYIELDNGKNVFLVCKESLAFNEDLRNAVMWMKSSTIDIQLAK